MSNKRSEAIENLIFLFERLGTESVPQWEYFRSHMGEFIDSIGGDSKAYFARLERSDSIQDLAAAQAYFLSLAIRHLEIS